MDVLGEIRSYEDLHSLLRARVNALQISRAQLNEIAGFQSGYAEKLLAAKPMRKLGTMSLAVILPALGVRLVLTEDPEALARIGTRLVKRRAENVRTAQCITISLRFLRSIAREGGKHSRSYMSKERASELGRKAALARWRNGR